MATFLVASVSLAQTIAPSQVTPRSLPAVPERNGGADIAFGTGGLAAPPGADKLNFQAGKIAIEGEFAELADRTVTLRREVEGQRITLARLYQWASELERAYARAGYLLARVSVPPQTLDNDGTVRIHVTDGYIEAVQVDGMPEHVQRIVLAQVAGLVHLQHLKMATLERALLLAGDLPGLHLTSALARGTDPGGTVLILSADQDWVTAMTTGDNRLPAALGVRQWGDTMSGNDLLGLGEQIYWSGSWAFGLEPGPTFLIPLEVERAGTTIPLGTTGAAVDSEHLTSATEQESSGKTPGTRGRYERDLVRFSYTAMRGRRETLVLNLTGEYDEQRLILPVFGTDLSRDAYGALRAGMEWQGNFGSTLIHIGGDASQGFVGRDAGDAVRSQIPLSRLGASPVFHKFAIDLSLVQPLPVGWFLNVQGRAQTSLERPLFRSEQFSLDGATALSAFADGTFSVDSGATLRTELQHPATLRFLPRKPVIAFYSFGATGRGLLYEPTVLERSQIFADTVGVGLRLSLGRSSQRRNVSLGLEYGRQFSDIPGHSFGQRLDYSVSLILTPGTSRQ